MLRPPEHRNFEMLYLFWPPDLRYQILDVTIDIDLDTDISIDIDIDIDIDKGRNSYTYDNINIFSVKHGLKLFECLKKQICI